RAEGRDGGSAGHLALLIRSRRGPWTPCPRPSCCASPGGADHRPRPCPRASRSCALWTLALNMSEGLCWSRLFSAAAMRSCLILGILFVGSALSAHALSTISSAITLSFQFLCSRQGGRGLPSETLLPGIALLRLLDLGAEHVRGA